MGCKDDDYNSNRISNQQADKGRFNKHERQGKLRVVLMRILIDSREQAPFTFAGYAVEVETATLPVGDYSLPGFTDRIAIERKTLDDLIGCLTQGRDRFERELAKGRPYDFFAVVVEASLADVYAGKYVSKMAPQSALQSLVAFQIRYRTPIIWAENRKGGEYMTHSFLAKYLREIQQSVPQLPGGRTVQNSHGGAGCEEIGGMSRPLLNVQGPTQRIA